MRLAWLIRSDGSIIRKNAIRLLRFSQAGTALASCMSLSSAICLHQWYVGIAPVICNTVAIVACHFGIKRLRADEAKEQRDQIEGPISVQGPLTEEQLARMRAFVEKTDDR